MQTSRDLLASVLGEGVNTPWVSTFQGISYNQPWILIIEDTWQFLLTSCNTDLTVRC